MKAFWYKEVLHIRVIPAKSLFNSTLIHEVVNRGDIFAMRVSDQQLTIVPGTAQVTHVEISPFIQHNIKTPNIQDELPL